MSEFDAIRPYDDSEVTGVLSRLVNDTEFLDAIISFKFSKLASMFRFALRGQVRRRLQKEVAEVSSVSSLQAKIESYLVKVIDDTVTELSTSGLERLDNKKAYLFVSNHRDIAMDSAFVNYILYCNGFTTLRIAIGDNLLTKPFASDLMRLNKSFIVNRSATAPREKLKAAKLLSKYIHHSVLHDGENVWIAQREGRAKDGLDRTNSAIVGMLSLSKEKNKSLTDFIAEASIVPVSISYEYDPCDADKARELYKKDADGTYEKDEHEDVKSIARGITGYKGRVHLSFGLPLSGEFPDTETVTAELDKQILDNYVLHLSNCFAYELLHGRSPKVNIGNENALFTDLDCDDERKKFKARYDSIQDEHKPLFLAGYANPVVDKLSMCELNAR